MHSVQTGHVVGTFLNWKNRGGIHSYRAMACIPLLWLSTATRQRAPFERNPLASGQLHARFRLRNSDAALCKRQHLATWPGFGEILHGFGKIQLRANRPGFGVIPMQAVGRGVGKMQLQANRSGFGAILTQDVVRGARMMQLLARPDFGVTPPRGTQTALKVRLSNKLGVNHLLYIEVVFGSPPRHMEHTRRIPSGEIQQWDMVPGYWKNPQRANEVGSGECQQRDMFQNHQKIAPQANELGPGESQQWDIENVHWEIPQ